MSSVMDAGPRALDVEQLVMIGANLGADDGEYLRSISVNDRMAIDLMNACVQGNLVEVKCILGKWQEREPRRSEVITCAMHLTAESCLGAYRLAPDESGDKANHPRFDVIRHLVHRGADPQIAKAAAYTCDIPRLLEVMASQHMSQDYIKNLRDYVCREMQPQRPSEAAEVISGIDAMSAKMLLKQITSAQALRAFGAGAGV